MLEHNSNSPNEVKLELDFGAGGKIDFSVPTMKFLDYSIEDLKKQHMVILLPLYLLKLRQQINKAVKQDENRNALRNNAQALKDLIYSILKSVEENKEAGNLDHNDVYVLTGLLDMLYDHLYGGIKEFEEEGVKGMLAEKLLVKYEDELEEKLAEKLEEKLAEKLEEKHEEDMLNVAIKLLSKGMSAEDIVDTTELPIAKIRGLQLQKVTV